MPPDPAPILAALRAELDLAVTLPPAELAALADHATDAAQLRRWIKRRLAGEALAHIHGRLHFDGLTLHLDKRAYVTDPELVHLVAAVRTAINQFVHEHARPPVVAEIGVGAGSLSLALRASAPDATFVGLDLDPDALAVAAANSARLGLPLRLVESDLFESWPTDLPPPDLVFGDPPWGDDTMLYAVDRPAQHYHAMPPASAFPLGGATGVHRQIIHQLAARAWPVDLWLNGGVIPPATLHALGRHAAHHTVIAPAPGLHLLHCRGPFGE